MNNYVIDLDQLLELIDGQLLKTMKRLFGWETLTDNLAKPFSLFAFHSWMVWCLKTYPPSKSQTKEQDNCGWTFRSSPLSILFTGLFKCKWVKSIRMRMWQGPDMPWSWFVWYHHHCLHQYYCEHHNHHHHPVLHYHHVIHHHHHLVGGWRGPDRGLPGSLWPRPVLRGPLLPQVLPQHWQDDRCRLGSGVQVDFHWVMAAGMCGAELFPAGRGRGWKSAGRGKKARKSTDPNIWQKCVNYYWGICITLWCFDQGNHYILCL